MIVVSSFDKLKIINLLYSLNYIIFFAICIQFLSSTKFQVVVNSVRLDNFALKEEEIIIIMKKIIFKGIIKKIYSNKKSINQQ